MAKKMKDKMFGRRLFMLRNRLELTQDEAAKKIGVSYSAIQSNEAGQRPNSNNLHKYVSFYECSMSWLLTGEGQPYPDGSDTPIYNKVEDGAGKVSPPDAEYELHGGWKPRAQSEEWNLVGKALEVLTSETIYKTALAANINAFYHALETKKSLNEKL